MEAELAGLDGGAPGACLPGGKQGINGRVAVANGEQWCESYGFPMWSNLMCTHLPWANQMLGRLT